MIVHSEILRYMGHSGGADAHLETLVLSCLEKLTAVYTPRHVTMQLPCIITGNRVTIGELNIESKELTAHLLDCTQAYLFAATLGAAVDRLIAQRTKIDSAEALCIQACAAYQIEDHCNRIEQELSEDLSRQGFYLRPRFSPGYGDFDITHQTDVLRILQVHKRIGVTETKTHMLTPLKSITAVIGIGAKKEKYEPELSVVPCRGFSPDKCGDCSKTDCPFKARGFKT
ncbi:MAG: hypothetical protein FWG27_00575 [Treponema sp.]|nr:hypothetical protein [Treponema sp.]